MITKSLETLGLIIFISTATNLYAQDNSKLETLKLSAEAGDAKSQFEYGMELRMSDSAKAKTWVQRAADQNYAEAWYWLGYAWNCDTLESYEKAAELGYEPAFKEVFDAFLFRAGPNADVVKAKRFADLARKKRIKVGGYMDNDEYYGTIDTCYAAGNFEIPKNDLPEKEERKLYSDVEGHCIAYHEGLGVHQDDHAYLKCLLSDEYIDYNRVAEINANGWGVKKNTKLAISISCHASDVPAELISVVQDINNTHGDKHSNEIYRFCNNITSGYNQGRCAYDQEWINTQRRLYEISALTLRWNIDDKKLLESALIAAEDFFRVRSSEEIDMSGTARAALAIEEQSRLRTELLQNITNFEAGTLPTNLDLNAEENNLNRIYNKIVGNNKFGDFTTINTKGIEATQRAWLKYRDTFIEFAALHYNNTTADSWSAWLTNQRTKQLTDLYKLFD